MKKLIAVALCIILTVLLTACQGGSGGGSSSDASRLTLNTGATVDVKAYAEKGEIFNCEFKLGTAIDEIKLAYHYGDEEYWGAGSETSTASDDVKHNIDATPLEIYGEDPIRLITGDAKYYYHPASEADGVAYVAYFGDAYGFRVGISVTEDIKAALTDEPVADGFAESEDVFFIPGAPEEIYKLEYSINGKYTLSFFFENGKLAATTLYDVALW